MPLNTKRHSSTWIMILISFLVVSIILWNTYEFFQKFKEEERLKMEIFSAAQMELARVIDLEESISNLPLSIIQSNTTTPMIIEDAEGFFQSKNIDTNLAKDQTYLNVIKEQFRKENEPIEVIYDGKVLSTVYYGDSKMLNNIKYYPLTFVLIILMFVALSYFFYRSSRIAAQNKLWSAMAKETAHQIGTPLSSLIGWTELLKSENTSPDYIAEIEKDIERLKTITERFSKIGSKPLLVPTDVVKITRYTFDYLSARSSKLVKMNITAPNEILLANLNSELYSWTIENLVKNGIDAMKGKGQLQIVIVPNNEWVHIKISDTGQGLSKSNFKKVFETGYTTKKRGWGLGLSLSKRIVEEYHQGRIRIENSEIGKGTTMMVSLKRLN